MGRSKKGRSNGIAGADDAAPVSAAVPETVPDPGRVITGSDEIFTTQAAVIHGGPILRGCPVCGATDPVTERRYEGKRLRRCRRCGWRGETT